VNIIVCFLTSFIYETCFSRFSPFPVNGLTTFYHYRDDRLTDVESLWETLFSIRISRLNMSSRNFVYSQNNMLLTAKFVIFFVL